MCYTKNTSEIVLKAVTEYFKDPPDIFVTDKSGKQEITEKRFIAATLLRKHAPGLTLKNIATLLGRTDHTTVRNMFIRTEELIDTKDEKFVPLFKGCSQHVAQALKGDA
jgi:chromosomal replication initiation ATPase DnaA